MDLSDRIALVYAEDLMKLVMTHRNIQWESSLGTDAFEDEAKGHFPIEMGRVAVFTANVVMNEWKQQTREYVLDVINEGLESHISWFLSNFYELTEHTTINTVYLMAHIAQTSIMFYLNGVEDAPLQGIRILSRFIQDEVPNRADMLGGLQQLREQAARLIDKCQYRIP